MLEPWTHDLESLEAISQDAEARAILLQMAALSRDGRLEPFLSALMRDDDLDEESKHRLLELASDGTFLRAVEDYVDRTRSLH
jgi:hypothetical protein